MLLLDSAAAVRRVPGQRLRRIGACRSPSPAAWPAWRCSRRSSCRRWSVWSLVRSPGPRARHRAAGRSHVDRVRATSPCPSRSASIRCRAVMILVVTGIGFLIHVYSTGYMHEERDSEYARYFSYLNLFAAFMLVLVLGANFLLMFVGWEGVGLCSYLLIGFWYDEEVGVRRRQEGVHRQPHRRLRLPARHDAAALAPASARLDFQERCAGRRRPRPRAGVRRDLARRAACSSSARPASPRRSRCYVWLPDAMEGPTPVSRADPCRDDGDGGRVHDRRATPCSSARADDARGRRRSSARSPR